MSSIRKSSRTLAFTALLAVFALAAGVGMLVPTTADAVPAHGTHIDYYSTPACGTQVGYRYYDCNGVLKSSWGTTSPYSQSATYGCIQEL